MKMKQPHLAFILGVLESAKQMSKDPKTQVSAVIVSPDFKQFSIGINGQPSGVPEIWDDEEKHHYVIHAEENAILQCPFKLEGSILFVSHKPCHKCLARIVQVGIKAVFYVEDYRGKATCESVWQTIKRGSGIQVHSVDKLSEMMHMNWGVYETT